MKISLRLRLLFIVTFVGQLHAWAQDPAPTEGAIEDTEVIIEKKRAITLPPQDKRYEFIRWTSPKILPPKLTHTFRPYSYQAPNDTTTFVAAKAAREEKPIIYNQYLKAGYGNYASPLVDLSLSAPWHERRILGLKVSHHSFGTGAVDGKNSASGTTEARLYGAYLAPKHQWTSSLHYRLDENYYYGYPEGTRVNRDSLRHTAHFLRWGLRVADRVLDDRWKYAAQTAFRRYSDNFQARENTFSLGGSLHYADKVVLHAQAILSSYQNTGVNQFRSYWRMNPYYRWQLDELSLDVGVSLSGQNDRAPHLPRFKIFPYTHISYQIDPDFSLFILLDGGFDFRTLYETAITLPMLSQSAVLANADRAFDLSAGVVGNPSESWSVKGVVGLQTFRYFPMYANQKSDPSRIAPIYSQDRTIIFTLNASAHYQINPAHEVAAAVTFYNYTSEKQQPIYHQPNTEITLSGTHQIIEKLKARWHFAYTGGLQARNPTDDQPVKLPGIFLLDLQLHYQLKTHIGIFASAENLLNRKYSRYLYYPQRGLLAKAGVTLRINH